MKRREFVTLVGGAVAWPLAARAQQSERMRRIGVLMGYSESDAEAQAWIAIFLLGLKQLGWIEGRNVQFDYRWAGGNVERMESYAAELAALNPDLVLAGSTPALAALWHQTRTIPIVIRERCRSGRARLYFNSGAPRQKHYRLYFAGVFDGGQMGGNAQGDFTFARADRSSL
jgi:ABC transporter substrate binding protein